MKHRKQALGSLIQIERMVCWNDEFDIVLTRDNRCYVHRNGEEADMTGAFQYLMKQAGRNLFEEERQWKRLQE